MWSVYTEKCSRKCHIQINAYWKNPAVSQPPAILPLTRMIFICSNVIAFASPSFKPKETIFERESFSNKSVRCHCNMQYWQSLKSLQSCSIVWVVGAWMRLLMLEWQDKTTVTSQWCDQECAMHLIIDDTFMLSSESGSIPTGVLIEGSWQGVLTGSKTYWQIRTWIVSNLSHLHSMRYSIDKCIGIDSLFPDNLNNTFSLRELEWTILKFRIQN